MNITQSKLNNIFRLERNIIVGFLPFLFNDDKKEHDSPSRTPTELVIQERIKAFQVPDDKSGWERVKFALFTPDENGDFSPHVQMISSSSLVAALVGFAYGGFEKSKLAYIEFLRTNQATKFDTNMEAKRRLQDRVTIGLVKGGLQLGWRTGLFAFLFTSVSSALCLYRNKEGILEYTTGGLVAGMAYRTHLGIRGVIVGGILGSTLGTVTGLINTVLLKTFGVSASQLREVNYSFMLYRSSSWEEEAGGATRDDSEESLLMDRKRREKTQRLSDNLENIDTEW